MYNKISIKSIFNKKQKLNLMGAKVKVYTELVPKSVPPTDPFDSNGRRQWNQVFTSPPRVGWIVGFRTVFEGIIHGGSYDDRGYLNITRSISTVLVSYTPYKKPVYVAIDGFSLEPDGKTDFRESHWDDRAKQDAKKWVKDLPRDKKGRWIPQSSRQRSS